MCDQCRRHRPRPDDDSAGVVMAILCLWVLILWAIIGLFGGG